MEALDRVDGVFTRNPDDITGFTTGIVELDFGPDAWVLTAGPSEDSDRDGRAEPVRTELDGLVGQPVLAAVRLDF